MLFKLEIGMANRLLWTSVAALLLCGACQAKGGRPAWLGGTAACELDGPIAEDVQAPAVPKVELTPLTHALYHVLPENGTPVTLRLRINERGYITSACPVGDAPEDILEATIRYALAARDRGLHITPRERIEDAPFLPARANGRDVASAITMTFRWEPPAKDEPGRGNLTTRAAADVVWLEKQALADAADRRAGEPGAAYARLGDLGTPRALRALARIEEAASSAAVREARSELHHFAVNEWNTVSSARAPDGSEFRLVLHPTFHSAAIGLTWRSPGSKQWGRPYLVARVFERPLVGDPNGRLRWLGPGRLVFLFEGRPTPPFTEGTLVRRPGRPQTRLPLVVDELVKDIDGDGWTDIEEQRMGLDPADPDSDADGVADGLDICPNHPLSADAERDEVQVILRKALLAVAGLPRTPYRSVLMASPDSTPVSLVGWSGPVLYGQAGAVRQKTWDRGATWAAWRILLKTPTVAAVEVELSRGGTAGIGYEVFLRKRGGVWRVVLQEMTWIS